jgi:hypothetical protein
MACPLREDEETEHAIPTVLAISYKGAKSDGLCCRKRDQKMKPDLYKPRVAAPSVSSKRIAGVSFAPAHSDARNACKCGFITVGSFAACHFIGMIRNVAAVVAVVGAGSEDSASHVS